MERERIRARLERHIVDLDPKPLALALHAEKIRKLLAIDDKVEASRAQFGAPFRRPVLRTDEDIVASALLHFERRRRVGDGMAETVREQIAGPHLVDELRINRPSAEVLKLLAFEQDRLGRDRPSRAKRHQCRHQPFHASFPFSITCQ